MERLRAVATLTLARPARRRQSPVVSPAQGAPELDGATGGPRRPVGSRRPRPPAPCLALPGAERAGLAGHPVDLVRLLLGAAVRRPRRGYRVQPSVVMSASVCVSAGVLETAARSLRSPRSPPPRRALPAVAAVAIRALPTCATRRVAVSRPPGPPRRGLSALRGLAAPLSAAALAECRPPALAGGPVVAASRVGVVAALPLERAGKRQDATAA